MKRVLDFIFLSVIVAISSSCNIDEEITTALPPKIILDSETGIYTTKQGREIIIAPSYESAEGASYSWIVDGRYLGNSPTLSFMRESVGEYYITLTVTTNAGSDREEMRVDVVELEIPTVSITGGDNITVAVDSEIKLIATVRQTSLPTSFHWSVNDEEVSNELVYTFNANNIGSYIVSANASNEDGSHSDSITIDVVSPEDVPFEWGFDRTAYHTVVGRKLLIAPTTTKGLDDSVNYCWEMDGEAIANTSKQHIFTAATTGEYHLSASATALRGNNEITITHNFVVTVYEAGAYYRARSGASNANWNKVYEYTPAPGQFINELKTGGFDGTQTTPEAAIAYAERRMSEVDNNGNPYPNWVSLGGFGGYIVVGFDHSIDNSGDYDLAVLGNSFSGSSEPGIVWVMQDENGNGLPDDTWYELAGSETGKAETIRNYEVTYYRPSGASMPVQWTDNQGNSGEVDYLTQFHRQEYYYPLWIEADSYTLRGTCLAPRNYDASGNGSYWVNAEYDWGYADNFSPVDREGEGDNSNAIANTNHFKISNAIDIDGESISLDFIDFVKVQCGVNTKSGWLGEVSTEVFGFYDYNMKK
ncbi:MAG: cell surface protein [Alistipes sp.]|nr:cell surface protein [Alistipes sp.]